MHKLILMCACTRKYAHTPHTQVWRQQGKLSEKCRVNDKPGCVKNKLKSLDNVELMAAQVLGVVCLESSRLGASVHVCARVFLESFCVSRALETGAPLCVCARVCFCMLALLSVCVSGQASCVCVFVRARERVRARACVASVACACACV
jgi:hypothetical protein